MTSYIVAIDHPSLLADVRSFVDVLHTESRRFDRGAAANPKPFPSLVRKVCDPTRRRYGCVLGDRLVGMASLAADGEVSIAVAADERGRGHGGRLLHHVAETAQRDGYGRLVMYSTRRSRPVAVLADRFGWSTFDIGRGRVALVLDLERRMTG